MLACFCRNPLFLRYNDHELCIHRTSVLSWTIFVLMEIIIQRHTSIQTDRNKLSRIIIYNILRTNCERFSRNRQDMTRRSNWHVKVKSLRRPDPLNLVGDDDISLGRISDCQHTCCSSSRERTYYEQLKAYILTSTILVTTSTYHTGYSSLTINIIYIIGKTHTQHSVSIIITHFNRSDYIYNGRH